MFLLRQDEDLFEQLAKENLSNAITEGIIEQVLKRDAAEEGMNFGSFMTHTLFPDLKAAISQQPRISPALMDQYDRMFELLGYRFEQLSANEKFIDAKSVYLEKRESSLLPIEVYIAKQVKALLIDNAVELNNRPLHSTTLIFD